MSRRARYQPRRRNRSLGELMDGSGPWATHAPVWFGQLRRRKVSSGATGDTRNALIVIAGLIAMLGAALAVMSAIR